MWTSGLRNSTRAIHLNEEDSQTTEELLDSSVKISNGQLKQLNLSLFNDPELKCSKNVDSITIINILNFFYFFVCFIINLFLISNSILIHLKLKKKLTTLTKLIIADAATRFDINQEKMTKSIYVENLSIKNNNLTVSNINLKSSFDSIKNSNQEENIATLTPTPSYQGSFKNNSQCDKSDILEIQKSKFGNLLNSTNSIVVEHTYLTKQTPNLFTRYLIVNIQNLKVLFIINNF